MAGESQITNKYGKYFWEIDSEGYGLIRVDDDDLAVEIKDPDSDYRAEVDWDGVYNALAVTDGRMVFNVDDGSIAGSQIPQTNVTLNYGYHGTDNAWTRFITDTDDGSIATGQKPQLINSLMYFYDDKLSAWKRWEGDSSAGGLYTMVIGLYTPTFDSMCDDTFDALKVISPKSASINASTGVTVGSTSTNVLAANASRKKAIIVNDSNETIYLKYGTGATANSGIRLNANGGSLEEDVYTGIITGICASGGKVVTVTEI